MQYTMGPGAGFANVADDCPMPTRSALVDDIANKSASVSGTAGRLSSVSAACKLGVQVRAALGNTANVHIGTNTDVTAGTNAAKDGYELGPGESILLPVTNVNLLYTIAVSGTQKLFYFVV